MGEGLLQFFLKEKDDREKLIYLLLSITLTAVITAKLYIWRFGDFYLIPLSDGENIKNFFLSGRFIIISIAFIVVYKLFYGTLRIPLYIWFAALIDKLFDGIRALGKNPAALQSLDNDERAKRFFEFVIKLLKRFSLIDVKDGQTKVGLSFHSMLSYFKDLNAGEEDLDEDIAYYPLPLTLQLLFLFDTGITHRFHLGWLECFAVNIAIIILLLIQSFIYFLNVLVELKKDKILLMMEKILELSEKKANNQVQTTPNEDNKEQAKVAAEVKLNK
jgi:hypothetical protein